MAESEIIGANHLGFTKSLFQQYSQQLRLNSNHYPAESAFNFYINNKITECLGGTVNIEAARENFYTELFQYTNLPKNYNFTPIIREINQTIESWKKHKIESPTALSYHYTPRSTINISSDAFTSNVTSTFGRLQFQSKQLKEDLLRPYGAYFKGFKSRSPMPSGIQSLLPQPDFETTTLWELSEKKEKRSENQEFTYQNPISENSKFGTPNHLFPNIVINHSPIDLIVKSIQQPPQQPNSQNQQPFQQPPQPPNLDPMVYAPIAKLDNFTGKEDDAQIWLNDVEKAIAANG
ncbi:hypothetical protein G9A89_007805 [Geosiphon pyriformis]|nr:hypothetical protein G9A89_007805 [Geosiphon pyriformis]